MAAICKPPMTPKPKFDPPPAQPRRNLSMSCEPIRMVFPPKDLARMHYDGIEPVFPPKQPEPMQCQRVYEGIGNSHRFVTIAASTNVPATCIAMSTGIYDRATYTNLDENPEIKKAYQKEQRQIKKTLKNYGIDLIEWQEFSAPWR